MTVTCALFYDLFAVALQPHLGTDRLIGILRAFRAQLLALGVQIRWGTAIRSVDIVGGRAAGVHLEGEVIAGVCVPDVSDEALPNSARTLRDSHCSCTARWWASAADSIPGVSGGRSAAGLCMPGRLHSNFASDELSAKHLEGVTL